MHLMENFETTLTRNVEVIILLQFIFRRILTWKIILSPGTFST